MKKINKKLVVAIVTLGLAFSVFIFFSVIHNASNKRFSVEFFQGVDREGYEDLSESAKIQVSPDVAWDHVGGGWKFAGWACLVLTWVAIIFVSTNGHQGNKRANDPGGDRTGLGIAIILAPVIFCCAFFFGGYSSKYVSNYESVDKVRFDEWVESGAIEKKGEKTYVDNADTLRNLFNQKFIQ